jgi:hypothetical protein
MLIRAFRGDDGTWCGGEEPPAPGTRHLLPFFPAGHDPAAASPFAGLLLVLDIGETTTPPGWTRFHLPSGTFYATDIVCWLLFGAETPDCWPFTRRCASRC